MQGAIDDIIDGLGDYCTITYPAIQEACPCSISTDNHNFSGSIADHMVPCVLCQGTHFREKVVT